jgi:hypothetical protein
VQDVCRYPRRDLFRLCLPTDTLVSCVTGARLIDDTYCNELNMPALESTMHIAVMLSCLDVSVKLSSLSNLNRPPLLISGFLSLVEASLHLVVVLLLGLM